MSYYYNDNGGRRRFLGNVPRVTRNLIIINIIIFLATWIGIRRDNYIFFNLFGLFPPTDPGFHIWQPVTHMFIHGSFWHILFNMYTLGIFGSVVERMIGERKFLIFYFICGLGAAAMQVGAQYVQGDFAVSFGASGAVYGLLIAYALLFPESKLTLIFPPVTLSAKWMVIVFAGIEVVTELLSSPVPGKMSVGHIAHLGGMLFGWLLIKYWKSRGTLFDRKNL